MPKHKLKQIPLDGICKDLSQPLFQRNLTFSFCKILDDIAMIILNDFQVEVICQKDFRIRKENIL